MKTKILLLPFLLLPIFNGCVSTSKLTRELAKDPASAYISVQTIYGNIKIVRTNPSTNTSVSITGEGDIQVDRRTAASQGPLDEQVRAIERLRALK